MNQQEKTHKLLCIVCPEGCEIVATDRGGELSYGKGICRRGQEYARQEIRDPSRILTSTVPISGGTVTMLPVRSEKPIPKPLLMDAMKTIKSIRVTAPVNLGEVIYPNLLDTGVALLAGRSIGKK